MTPVCFHGETECSFCWPGGKPRTPKARKRRCAACGRFLWRTDRGDQCKKCIARKFRALRLFRTAA